MPLRELKGAINVKEIQGADVVALASSYVLLLLDNDNKIVHVRNTGVGSPIRQMVDMARDGIYKAVGIAWDAPYDYYIYSADGHHVVGFNSKNEPIHVEDKKLFIEFISDERLSQL